MAIETRRRRVQGGLVVRAATTANGTLATSFANGSVIDGVTLATGDRILLKNQTTQTDNGVYTVNASGAPTRTKDVLNNCAVRVEQGTVNASKTYAPDQYLVEPGVTALTYTLRV